MSHGEEVRTPQSFRELAREWRKVVKASGVRIECAEDLERLCDEWDKYINERKRLQHYQNAWNLRRNAKGSRANGQT